MIEGHKNHHHAAGGINRFDRWRGGARGSGIVLHLREKALVIGLSRNTAFPVL